MSSRSLVLNTHLHPQPRNDVHERANAFDEVDEGDTEELVGKRADGEGQIRRREPDELLGLRSELRRLDPTFKTARAPQALLPASTLRRTVNAPANFQPQIEQGDSQLANVDLVDRLISLWTTVKP